MFRQGPLHFLFWGFWIKVAAVFLSMPEWFSLLGDGLFVVAVLPLMYDPKARK